MITIPGYQINQQIYESSKTRVYRGYRAEDLRPVVVKLLRAEYPLPEELARYRHEYQILCSLHLPGVVRAYDLQRYQHGLLIILEDSGGESLDHLLTDGTVSLDVFLMLAVQITEIVGALHRQHIIHKDLTPSNILWNPMTGELKIIDFGLATRLSREHAVLTNPEGLEGTLAYMSPEQTGRMNRSVDCRTDLYTLGVTFYQLLTGHIPFESGDPIAVIHAHIAKVPLAPDILNSTVPTVLSAIIMRLLAKMPEDRYQSAEGLQADLEACVRQLKQSGQIDTFGLGRFDAFDRFQISEKLYGRAAEIERLLKMFDHAAAGNTSIVLCVGQPGIGKSALIKEIYTPIVAKRGYFIAGKYDQFKRTLPYTALTQACQDFTHQLLTEGEASLQHWKTELLQSVGNNGQLIIDMIPALALVLGPQPEVQPLPAIEAQNRFQYVFQSFVQVITKRHHPLVLFLDDLQWADAASLSLLKLLMTTPAQHFLVIGAYRDTEVDAAHPLLPVLKEIERSRATVGLIKLERLSLDNVSELIADSLHCTVQHARPLANLVCEKTQGNSFFVNQFLKSLFEERLLVFNHKQEAWQWDIEQIRSRNVTDNVAALMADNIQKLPLTTQQVLQLAACIGSRFNLQTLTTINQQTLGETCAQLWPALTEGLIVPLDDHYKLIAAAVEYQAMIQSSFMFLHDRVLQAAYSLIPNAEKQAIHLNIGRVLLTNMPQLALGTRLFDIATHLNHGLELLADAAERIQVAELNLRAGQQAKAAAAYEIARRFLTAGIALLPADSWTGAYQLSYALHIECAECEYLLGNFDQAAVLFDLVLGRATTEIEQARIFNLLVLLNNNQAHLREAVDFGRRGLSILGVRLPEREDEQKAALAQEFAHIQGKLANIDIEDLAHQTELNELDKTLIMELCTNMLPPSYMIGDSDLYTLLILTMVKQSLVLGNSSLSSHAYIMYGVVLNIGFNDFALAYRFGELGLQLGQKYQVAAIDTKNYFSFATWLNPWRQHLKTNVEYYLSAYSRGRESGDMTFAAYAITNYLLTEIHRGERLDRVYQEVLTYLPFVERTKDHASIKAVLACRQFILCLKGQTREKDRLDDSQYDEDAQVAELRANGSLTVLGYYLLYKLIILYIYGNYTAAQNMAGDGLPPIGGNTFLTMAFLFYTSLIKIALYPTLPAEAQRAAREALSARQSQMQIWAEHSTENYRQLYLLMSAELARIESRDLEAMTLYDQAIQAAHDNEYLHQEALANELAAKFYLARGQAKIAKLYITEAHYLYGRWGANRKVQDLEQMYAHWQVNATEGALTAKTTSTHDTTTTKLDLATVLKASQAISSEIDFDKLLAQLIEIVIQNAGAERGYLLLSTDGTLQVEAWGSIENHEVVVWHSILLEKDQQPAPAIVNYVARTHEAVVLGDASIAGRFTTDPIVQARCPRSVLCVPILHTSRLIGVLYLENNLITDAFTPQRLEVLTLLASQIAISIENARLYANLAQQTDQIRAANVSLQHEVAERKRLEAQLVQAQKMEAIGRLAGGIAHDFNNLLTAILGYSDMILTELDADAPLRQEVKAIEMAGERAADLTRQLLAFSRQQVLQPDLLDLNTIVVRLSSMLRRLIGEDIEFITLLGQNLGLVLADPSQIEQVVLNLAINARDAMPKGGKLTITTAWIDLDANDVLQHVGLTIGRYVLLAISDTGHGMDRETQRRIFEPFFTTKAVGKGTGLGLAMVHGIVHQTGGHIGFSSEVGQGSTFTIYLPQAAEREITARPQKARVATPHGTETVLLVEDDAGVRALVGTILRKYGYTVLEATNGMAAQELVQRYSGPLDLLITDVIMPGGLSGVRLAEYVVEQRPQVNILYMSGYTDDAITQYGVLASGRAFLQKPFTPETLAHKVREVLDTMGGGERTIADL